MPKDDEDSKKFPWARWAAWTSGLSVLFIGIIFALPTGISFSSSSSGPPDAMVRACTYFSSNGPETFNMERGVTRRVTDRRCQGQPITCVYAPRDGAEASFSANVRSDQNSSMQCISHEGLFTCSLFKHPSTGRYTNTANVSCS